MKILMYEMCNYSIYVHTYIRARAETNTPFIRTYIRSVTQVRIRISREYVRHTYSE